MQPLDPRIERIAHSGMFSVFTGSVLEATLGEGYNRFETLEDAQAFLAERDLSEAFDGRNLRLYGLGPVMQPEIVGPETFYAADSGWSPEPVEDGPQETAHGYFARLSASGYLDCTEWSGPFETEAEAARYLIETYAND